jgi:hypothetical protein
MLWAKTKATAQGEDGENVKKDFGDASPTQITQVPWLPLQLT